ncbi:MAG: hypothetical protein H3C47_08230 [Candidatus Cloacimonetes bacterium]|nr:hypothetical protein [Candidatus Cloacimonadota bacterium]
MWFKILFLFVLLFSPLYANQTTDSDPISSMVSRLFEIVEIRHREILQTEENITHNRSDSEKQALTRILQNKVADFVQKDSRLASVLNELKSQGQSPEKAFLYEKSMERLNRLRGEINQIQELYFRKPLETSPAIDTKTGDGNFSEFLSSWEQKNPVSTQRKVVQKIVPAQDERYLAHLQTQSRNTDAEPQTEFEHMVNHMEGGLSQIPANRKIIAAPSRKPLDAYHQTLVKEAPVGPSARDRDQTFQSFYTDLEHKMEVQRQTGPTPSVVVSTPVPDRNTSGVKNFTQKLSIQTPNNHQNSPVETLLADLSRYEEQTKPKREVSVITKQANFDSFLNQIVQPVAVKPAIQSAKVLDNPFMPMPAQITPKASATPKAEVVKTVQTISEARSGQSFAALLSDMPENPLPAPKNSSAPEAQTNRFEVILSDLLAINSNPSTEKRKNPDQKPLKESDLESELKLVFVEEPDTQQKALANKTSEYPLSKHFVPDFEMFPHNTVSSANSHVRPIASPKLAAAPTSEPKSVPESVPDTADIGDTPLFSAGNDSDLKIRTQARLLRNQASLIPIRIEARDVKDRVYSDLPVEFVIEIDPKHSITGHILNAYKDEPFRRTVLTDSTGIAQIHLFLDLKGKEVNIKRELVLQKDKTLCKVQITPRFTKEDAGEKRL